MFLEKGKGEPAEGGTVEDLYGQPVVEGEGVGRAGAGVPGVHHRPGHRTVRQAL